MKKIFKILSVLLIIFAVFSISSCQQNDNLKEKTEVMLDALIENNFNEAFNLVSGITTKDDFHPIYSQIRDYISGVEEYELTQIGVNARTQNGITIMRTTYLMTTNSKTYIVETQARSDIEGLYGFNILESQISGNGVQCGTVTSMKGANTTQWIFLIIGFLEIAFVIAVFIDALRQKIDKKVVWLALILLGTAAITINSNANGVSFNLSAIISLVNNTALIKYATGATSIRIMIPIAAIVYLIKRKQLINSYKAKNAPIIDDALLKENIEANNNEIITSDQEIFSENVSSSEITETTESGDQNNE